MSKTSYIGRSRGVSRLYAHLVLVTKYRNNVINPDILLRLQQLSLELCHKWQCDCIDANGEEDHLHLLFRYAPQMQLSKFVNNFKAVTSRRIRSEYDSYLRQFYWDWTKGFWSESYSLDSVGFAPSSGELRLSQGERRSAPADDILRKYVENQGRNCLTTLRSVSQVSHPDSELKITERDLST